LSKKIKITKETHLDACADSYKIEENQDNLIDEFEQSQKTEYIEDNQDENGMIEEVKTFRVPKQSHNQIQTIISNQNTEVEVDEDAPKYCKLRLKYQINCSNCRAYPKYKNMNYQKMNDLDKKEIQMELQRHGHPFALRLPRHKQRNKKQAIQELIAHYLYAHSISNNSSTYFSLLHF
jgi:hypothetical protein